ncbi:PIN domain-containing protein [Candidatus Pacearchaeota archaeon]|nr:PIN domain-containing protein [Candidatus Pacearchaeota archaeon]
MTYRYFFDTYAIMEIIEGNKNYKGYLDSDVVINNFIFAELCYVLFRDKDKKAKEHLSKYSKYILSVKPEWIEEAMQFRLKWKDRSVSITDCIGYVMAKKMEIKFLTGDKEFEKMENVEFVK